MERIFSPWRYEYVNAGARNEECVLCRARDGVEGADRLVVHVAALNFVVMNLYPYNAGHLMIAPRRHVGSLGAATREVYHPEGINVGMNLGRPAGAGVADHIHLHVVPRWTGDTNFMTVLGNTRVIPEDPKKACARLRPYFK
jgi:ATP adenylyltransferase